MSAFDRWAAIKGISFPVLPAPVAEFVRETREFGIDWLEVELSIVSIRHLGAGFSDPVASPVVWAALEDIDPVERPRSWPKALWSQFYALPHNLRKYLRERDIATSRELRQAMNKAAELRSKIEKMEKTDGEKEPA